MLVPALVIELDEPHVALGQPPRQQAVGGVGAGLAGLGAVEVEDRVGLGREIHRVGHGRLHPVGHLVLRDARVDLRVDDLARAALSRARAACRASAAGWPAIDAVRIVQVEHRILAAAELHALVLRRQEAAAPQPRVERLIAFAGPRQQHDEAGQVGVLGAEPVGEPGADRRPAGLLRPGLDEGDRRIVVDRVGVHRPDDAQLVDDLRRVRQQLADPGAGLAVTREVELRAGHRERLLEGGHAGEALALADRLRQLLAVHRAQPRLVVEQLELRRAAALEQVDDRLTRGTRCGDGEQRPPARRRRAGRGAASTEGSSSDASAVEPMPRLVADRKCRRVPLNFRSSMRQVLQVARSKLRATITVS